MRTLRGNAGINQDIVSILNLVIRDLDGIVLPAVDDHSVQFVGRLLSKMLVLLRDRAAHPELLANKAGLLAEALDGLVGAHAIGSEDRVAGLTMLSELAAKQLSGRTAHPDDLWTKLIALHRASDLAAQGGVERSLGESFVEAGAGQVSNDKNAVIDADKLSVTGLQDFLGARPEYANAQVTELREVGTGSQKCIFFATVETDAGRHEWALRQDKGFATFGCTVAGEYPLLGHLHAAGLPVPNPVWFGQGPPLGHPIFATNRLTGSADFMAWGKDREQGRDVLAQVAQIMARLHRIDHRRINYAGETTLPGAIGATMADRIGHMRDYWQRSAPEPMPVVDACLAWLAAHAPEGDAVSCIVHGDFGLHNVLVEDGQVTALLDWEFAHLGDPHEDLSYIRPLVEMIGSWDEFLGAYRDSGGVEYDDWLARYYGGVGILRLALGSYYNITAVREDVDARLDIRVANSGYLYAGQLLTSASQAIAALAADTKD